MAVLFSLFYLKPSRSRRRATTRAFPQARRSGYALALDPQTERRVTDSPPPPRSRLQRLWLCEAIRLREDHAGPLEDAEANRLARQADGDLARRVEARALFLAKRDGQMQAQRHWLQGARLALLALLILALVGGAGLALAAL